MKKHWKSPRVNNLMIKDTWTSGEEICTNPICISKCEVCGGCTGSKTKINNCSYYANMKVKICPHIEDEGCKLPQS